ncbi:hypothetical protein LPJ60_003168 [Coemansia sp. RSA 2675]|nr:hypothetical protein LPJ60_003168 [Coemansia sp. RSA 2675]
MDDFRDPELLYYMLYKDSEFVCKFKIRNPEALTLENVREAEKKHIDDQERQVKADIATQLGIETDEFVFDSKYDNKENRHKVDMLFAEKYLPSNYEPDVDINGDWVPFELSLFKNEKYKGTTGILSWIIDQKKDLYCTEYYYGGGQLAHGFAKNVAAFKVQYNVKTISSVPSLVGDAAKK